MSEDLLHHIEGTLVAPGVFRVYFYDEYTRPMKAAGFSARVAPANDNAQETGAPIPLALAMSKDGNVMEARIPNAAAPNKTTPLNFKLHMKVKPDAKDWITDYHFEEYSKEPAPPPSAVMTGAAARPKSQVPATTAQRAPVTTGAAKPKSATRSTTAAAGQSSAPTAAAGGGMAGLMGLDPSLSAQVFGIQEKLPDTTPELLAELDKRNQEVGSELKQGALGSIWLPAIGTKDVALALENHISELPDAERALFSSAVMRLTLAAWQIDAYGDLGNKEKLNEVYQAFAAAVEDIKSAYGAAH
jgi:hypothetical protein